MDIETFNNFKTLRYEYYIAGRLLLVNGQFLAGCINLGYCIELSLKFILAFHNYPIQKLMKHDLIYYYQECVSLNYLTPLLVSEDFMKLCNERLDCRYPIMIRRNFNKSTSENRSYYISIDIIHAYDDLILQIDDQLINSVCDNKTSLGFIALRQILNSEGRIFFHANDHAFIRLAKYKEILTANREAGDNFEKIFVIISDPINKLWNFQGLLQYRPWGPKSESAPAKDYHFIIIDGNKQNLKYAQWKGNPCAEGLYLSLTSFILSQGTYAIESSYIIEKTEE